VPHVVIELREFCGKLRVSIFEDPLAHRPSVTDQDCDVADKDKRASQFAAFG
jgi:hypothetical protein